jgi:endonuclease G, mitochondrial
MKNQEKQELVRRYLERIVPESSIEGFSGGSSMKATIESVGGEDADLAAKAVRHIQEGKALPETEVHALEAIIIPGERPVLNISDGKFDRPIAPFEHLDQEPYRSNIQRAIPSIGRIDLPESPSIPYAGTGFIVGDGLLMTNRHVAEIFSFGLGLEGLRFRSGQTAAVDFLREKLKDDADYFRIRGVRMIHPYWDMALLEVEGLSEDRQPLTLTVDAPEDLLQQDVAVIGYPALDPRNNIDLQRDIFGGRFNVKRMQPGKVQERANLRSFGKVVTTVTHDSSTLGGNSGSAVVIAKTGKIVALHFAGIYLKANYAVSAADMARDSLIVDAGVQFDRPVPMASGPWVPYWNQADPPQQPKESSGAGGTQQVTYDGNSNTWTIPLTVTVNLGPPQKQAGAAAVTTDVAAVDAATAEIEKVPLVDTDYKNRSGYDDEFLGVRVPLPTVADESVLSKLEDGDTLIPYEHFSLVMHKKRRLAVFVAANIDNRHEMKEPEPGRDYSRQGLNGFEKKSSETWLLDPRIPGIHQLPDKFFTKDNKAFDKGHIFRREAATWGESYEQVQRANGDTFHVTNCSPQVLGFNRSNRHGIWGKLENKVGKTDDDRVVVFAGPVLSEDDKTFTGQDNAGLTTVQIPSRFWKLVIARVGCELQSFAFMLEQDLTDVPLEFQVDAFWRDRTISVSDLEKQLAIVTFPQVVHDSDQSEAD